MQRSLAAVWARKECRQRTGKPRWPPARQPHALADRQLRQDELTVPRARLQTRDGNTTEWHSQVLRSYQRRALTADALIAGAYLAGTNTRRVRRALAALYRDGVSKDMVSQYGARSKAIGTPGTTVR